MLEDLLANMPDSGTSGVAAEIGKIASII